MFVAIPDRRRRRGRVTFSSPVPVLFTAPPAGFSQIYITSVSPPVQTGSQLLLSWTANPPRGLWYQVYVNGLLVWYGTSLRAAVPLPDSIGRIDVGTVSAANRAVNYSGSLPADPERQVTLTWTGGTYEGADLVGFHVYGETSPSGGINYTKPAATIPAYTAEIITDGFGYGGFGLGGFGASSASYTWTSDVLKNGLWHYAVRAFDAAGNESTPQLAAVTIGAPPLPPAPYPDRTRLHYTYAKSSFKITLLWNSSPG